MPFRSVSVSLLRLQAKFLLLQPSLEYSMNINYPSDAQALRAEIAAAAARMIAEDGADYGTAKRKAAKMILGSQKIPGDVLPDNAEIEAEVRE